MASSFNKYEAFYERLMARAKTRVLEGYVERHHIIPRCLGGKDSRPNIVQLTAEEHYVAHQLLVKIHPKHFGLLWSAMAMTNTTGKMRRSNKRYGWLRRKFALSVSARFTGTKHSQDTRDKQRLAKLGKKREPHSRETKLKMSIASKGKPKSDAHRRSLSIAKLGNQNRRKRHGVEFSEI